MSGQLGFRVHCLQLFITVPANPVFVSNYQIERELVQRYQINLESFTLVRVIRYWQFSKVEPRHVPYRQNIFVAHFELDGEFGLKLFFRDDIEVFVHVESAFIVLKRIVVVKSLFDQSTEMLSAELLLRELDVSVIAEV